ncbi:putative thiamine transporter SLC35F3 isoform X1 [Frieseomelitta varia]|nr:putative thiamine transporter SLC35F3 isoform X1 [Frieseomelitta varia]XP_043509486.1 putative thiamine transporter SLC35F3 isoform X1 [Frieseomelitta varia]XP_043509488.1 putative thiamine transporter SLC35F3 isoform X1 [Frieseomelitta varia]
MGSRGVGDIPTIFHPQQTHTPSIILGDNQQNHGSQNTAGQITYDNSGCEQQQGCSISGGCGDSVPSCRPLETSRSGVGSGGAGDNQGHNISQTQVQPHVTVPPVTYQQRPNSLSACYASCCAESAKKIYFGVCVTICVTASWVGATHCIKYLYFYKHETPNYSLFSNSSITGRHQHTVPYNAPFFTTWFCTNWEILYFPVYFLCQSARIKCNTPSEIIAESLRGFRDKGFTGGRFLIRCSLFCGLWVVTNYMYIYSLRILLATDVMALFATNVSCVYLLSWVILHEQFVGVRIVAVILCNTGIALLAYMDGITGSPTLGGVVLATSAAAGSAVYKVLFKKVIGETTFGQMSLFFSLIGLCNAALLWPICLALYFSGAESIQWGRLPWTALLSASILHLVANMLGNFSIALTYDLFITLGLITAVPVSAALDVLLYGAHFMGMKLAGMIFIAVGFFLVMFPDNWPDYITRLLRNIVLMSHSSSTTGGGQQRRSTFARSRCPSMQQRQYRLRSYGVSSAHGDGQMLLPMNSSNSNQANNNQSSSEPPMTTMTANPTHRHTNSSQQNNTASESQRRRVPISISTSTLTPISTSITTTISTSTSTSTSTSITTSTTTNSHQRSHPPGLQN